MSTGFTSTTPTSFVVCEAATTLAEHHTLSHPNWVSRRAAPPVMFLDSTVWIGSSCKDLSSRNSTLLGPQQGRDQHKRRVRQDSEEPTARACTTWHRGRDNISWHQDADTSNVGTKTTRKPAVRGSRWRYYSSTRQEIHLHYGFN